MLSFIYLFAFSRLVMLNVVAVEAMTKVGRGDKEQKQQQK